jgi:arabinose-5-phosphate isomerase
MIVETGRAALQQEAGAIVQCAEGLGEAFEKAVLMILNCPGRVIPCGIGKSGHIARKTAGTLSSTGTPSLFLHAAEAVHGDLGMVTGSDIVLLYSHSGETAEILELFPALRSIGATSILITGRPSSRAAQLADLVLDTAVVEEACTIRLAPTTSTTVMLALSGALAIAVMDQRGFSSGDFARFHPAGTLGRRLLLRVADVMRQGDDLATVSLETSFMETLRSITSAGAGAACVVDDGGMVGIITDGDLRRCLLNDPKALESTAGDIMNRRFSTLEPDLLAAEALEMFLNHPKKIGEMPVLDDGTLVGLVVLKDLLRSGIV